MKSHFVVCSCQSSEHTLRFIYDSDAEELYCEVQLNQYRGLFKRLLVAIKYVLGYKCKYGHWDNTIVSRDEMEKLYFFLKNRRKSDS